jgi:4-amino-4-deoxy-L-arabinose transferase-like glycosyltransferase
MALQPIVEWCAPEWGGHGYHEGLYQDHPPGILWMPALLIRLGFPELSAAFCANFIYVLLSLYVIFLLARHFEGSFFGWSAVFAFMLTPIFLQYLIRANQEPPLNLAVVAGLYGVVRSEESWKYKALFVASLVFAFLIKGVSAFILAALALVCWLIFLRKRSTLIFIFLAVLCALGTMGAFELWYRQVTGGVGFWQNYLAFHHGQSGEFGLNPLRKISNLIWYTARALWFSAPWVFFIFYGFFKQRKDKVPMLKNRFFMLCLSSALFVILLFSLVDRRADRYIFPAYTFLAVAGMWIVYHFKPRLARFLKRKEKNLPLYLSGALILFTLARIVFHNYLS